MLLQVPWTAVTALPHPSSGPLGTLGRATSRGRSEAFPNRLQESTARTQRRPGSTENQGQAVVALQPETGEEGGCPVRTAGPRVENRVLTHGLCPGGPCPLKADRTGGGDTSMT